MEDKEILKGKEEEEEIDFEIAEEDEQDIND